MLILELLIKPPQTSLVFFFYLFNQVKKKVNVSKPVADHLKQFVPRQANCLASLSFSLTPLDSTYDSQVFYVVAGLPD